MIYTKRNSLIESREIICPYPCLNGGTCVLYDFKPICSCRNGFTGLNCAVSIFAENFDQSIQSREFALSSGANLGLFGFVILPCITIVLFSLALTKKLVNRL